MAKGVAQARESWECCNRKPHPTSGEIKLKTLFKRAIGAAGYEVKRIQPRFYDEDGLRSEHDHRFIQDERFANACSFAELVTNNGSGGRGLWRIHVALWTAQNAFRLDGDFVECGVYRGFLSSAIVNYLNWNSSCGDRRLLLFDTFSGLVDELLSAEEIAAGRVEKYGDTYNDIYDAAVATFRGVRNAKIIRGIVPESLATQAISSVSYLHLDMNCAAPEVAALEYFWPKMTKGGLVLMDDYTYVGYEPQHVALDEFATSVGYEILSLPTGQGLLIK